MIKVSVVMPVYNAERFLRECLNSVIGQTLKDIEIICVDDASSDKSPAILSVYAKLDKRIKVLTHNSTQYAGVARNKGLMEAKGKYLVFWDADDFFEPDALEKMYLQCEKDEADICVCAGRVYNMVLRQLVSAHHYLDLSALPSELPFAAMDHPEAALRFTNPAPWNKMFNREFIKKEGIEFQNLRSSNDVFFTYAALAVAKRITVVDRILINYRSGTTHSLQETNAQSPFCFYEALLHLREWLTERQLMNAYEKGYLNLALGMCFYNLSYQKTKDAWLIVAEKLKDEIFKDLGLLKHPRHYFSSQQNYDAMMSLVKKSSKQLAAHEPQLQQDEGTKDNSEEKALAEQDDSIKVSVIVPVYNTEEYLEECLSSVIRQSLSAIEILCVNDGSTDGSAAILERYAKKDKRIKVITQENSGLSVARNTGLNSAQGTYVNFLDSDDLLPWCALEHLYALASTKNLDLLFYEAESFYDRAELYTQHPAYRTCYRYQGGYEQPLCGQKLMISLMDNHDFKPSACLQMFRRAFLVDEAMSFYPGILHEDNLFTVHGLMVAKRAGVLGEPLYLRRVREDSIMSDKNWKHAYGYLVCLREINKLLVDLQIKNSSFIDAVLAYQVIVGETIILLLESLGAEEVEARMATLPPGERAQITLLLANIMQNRSALQEVQAELEAQNKHFTRELKSTKESASFRAGAVVTWPLRKLKRLTQGK
ncbi:MAG: glycosyltransferase [Coriobacteriia bacterium]|nr:glycosyltransferase [Coriobacteriia bacterium]